MRIIQTFIGLLLTNLIAQTAYANGDIQMLPPTFVGSVTPCDMTSGSNQLVLFNGNPSKGSAINCDTLFTADPNDGAVIISGTRAGYAAYDRNGTGNSSVFYRLSEITRLYDNTYGDVLTYDKDGHVTVANTLQIGNSGQLTNTSANTLLSLQNTSCLSGAALTKTSGGIGCLAVVESVGPVALPGCPPGEVLTSTGSTLTCIPQTPLVSVSCPSGQVLNGVVNGQPVCVAQAGDDSPAINGFLNRQWYAMAGPLAVGGSGTNAYHVNTWYTNTYAWPIEEQVITGGNCSTYFYLSYVNGSPYGSGYGAMAQYNSSGNFSSISNVIPPGVSFELVASHLTGSYDPETCAAGWTELR